jgi:23S rRNA pseudouridine1911/1915/1917 synthase
LGDLDHLAFIAATQDPLRSFFQASLIEASQSGFDGFKGPILLQREGSQGAAAVLRLSALISSYRDQLSPGILISLAQVSAQNTDLNPMIRVFGESFFDERYGHPIPAQSFKGASSGVSLQLLGLFKQASLLFFGQQRGRIFRATIATKNCANSMSAKTAGVMAGLATVTMASIVWGDPIKTVGATLSFKGLGFSCCGLDFHFRDPLWLLNRTSSVSLTRLPPLCLQKRWRRNDFHDMFLVMKKIKNHVSNHKVLTVSSHHKGWKLRDFLTDTLYDFGSSAIGRILKEGWVVINDQAVDGGLKLKGGEVLVLDYPTDDLLRFPAKSLQGFSVLFEDDSVVVAMKPAGVGVTADRGQSTAPFLSALVQHFEQSKLDPVPRPRVVHRLDKETSGAVIVAKSRAALQDLTSQFADKLIEKEYSALVLGVPHKAEGQIDLPIGYETRSSKLRAGGKDAVEARTRFKVLEKFRGYALLAVWPITGRQHQIRIHLEAVGHPLAVDHLYGGQQALLLSQFKRKFVLNRTRVERPLLERLSLHASRVKFRSPATGETVEVSAEFPKDLRVAVRQLGKWARA